MSPTTTRAGSDLLSLYRGMRRVRETEEQLAKLFADGEIPGFIHLSIGQEAVAVGVGAALDRADTVASNHRGHGHALAKGLDLDRFFLEIMGKAEGYCGGRGGSMHVADMSVGMLGANGIVGAGIPIAVGSALAHRTRGSDAVAVAFFGDGAMAEGVLHESLNLAALWALPFLFVCENNGWSEFSPASQQLAAEPLKLAGAFGISAQRVDGNDVGAVHKAAMAAVALLRAGKGPFFLECTTMRVRGHFEGDPQKYRQTSDLDHAASSDPLLRCVADLKRAGTAVAEIEAIDVEARREVAQAVVRGRSGTLPSPEKALVDVYTPRSTHA